MAETRVLIAADDRATRSAVSWLLKEQGYVVACAADRKAIVEVLMAVDPDVLILDVQGLTDGGEGLLARIKGDARWRDLPVVATTRSSPDHTLVTTLPRGADDSVGKPLRVAELLARVQGHLRARSELRSTQAALRQTEKELERAREDVESSRRLVDILYEVTEELSATEIYRILARRVARALNISRCSVVLASPGDATAIVAAAFEDPSVSDLEIRLDRYPELSAALRTGRPVLVADARIDPLFADVRDLWAREGMDVPIRSVIALPFALDRWRSGVLFLRTERLERALTEEEVEFADMVIKAAVAAIKRAQALDSTRADNRRLEALATTDPLTRLLNRRALLDRLGAEIDRGRRFKSSVTLMLLDIDHFKSINDSAGHLAGDSVLRQLAQLLVDGVRTADVVARYGGEEFVVILPETSREGGVIFAERLRERIETCLFEGSGDESVHLTASIGVATFPSPRIDSTEDLFARADEALYRAKSGGRNQVRT